MWFVRRRHGLTRVHPTFYLCSGCEVAADLVAGPFSFVNSGCLIYPGVELGAYVLLANRVAIVGQDHQIDVAGTPMVFSERPLARRTVLEDDVWIGYGSVVRTGVHIQRGAVVGAGSVVTRDVGPYEIVAGTPARKIGERFSDPEERRKHDEMLKQAPPRRGHFVVPLDQQPFARD
jgi:acetyltransferase-like isoleucine patch superfamily enzyme